MLPTFRRMASSGGGHGEPHVLDMDPALVKYSHMTVKRPQYFRWTPRTAWISFVYIVAIPSVALYYFNSTSGKWDMRGKLKGDTIAEF